MVVRDQAHLTPNYSVERGSFGNRENSKDHDFYFDEQSNIQGFKAKYPTNLRIHNLNSNKFRAEFYDQAWQSQKKPENEDYSSQKELSLSSQLKNPKRLQSWEKHQKELNKIERKAQIIYNRDERVEKAFHRKW